MKKIVVFCILCTIFVCGFCLANESGGIQNSFDTISSIEYISTQLLDKGSVSLNEDDDENSFAKIKIGNEDLEFEILEVEEFDTSENGQLEFLIKPIRNVEWFEIYLNNMVLIKRFEIKKDFKMVMWNKILVDLDAVDIVESIKIKINSNAEFYLDDLKVNSTIIKDVDLNLFSGGKIEVTNGVLTGRKYGDNNYATLDNIVMTDGYSITHNDDSDWDNLENAKAVEYNSQNNCLMVGKVAFTPIGCDNKVFDGLYNTSWFSSQKGDNVKGNAYIGCEYATPQRIVKVIIIQANTYKYVNSLKLQYFDTVEDMWKDVETYNVDLKEYSAFNVSTDISATKWRLLANSGTDGPSYKWEVYEAIFVVDGEYISNDISLNIDNVISNLEISYEAENSPTFEVKISLDQGVTWDEWKEVENGERIPLKKLTQANNVKVKYKIKNSKNAISSIKSVKITMIINEGIMKDELKNKYIQKISILSQNQFETNIRTLPTIPESSTKILSDNKRKLYVTGTDVKEIDLESCTERNLGYRVTGISPNGRYWYIKWSNALYFYDYDLKVLRKMEASSSLRDTEYIINNDGILIYSTSTHTYVYNYQKDETKNVAVEGKIYLINNNLYISSTNIVYEVDIEREELKENKIYTGGYIECADANNNYLYLKANGKIKRIELDSYYTENINIDDTYTLTRAISENELAVKDENFDYIYDISTNKYTLLTPKEFTGNGMQYSYNGISRYIYNNKLKEVVEDEFEYAKYLLSFDEKNTWYTYKNGVWEEVCSDKPTKENIKQYGMTAQEINALKESDYKKLYFGDKEIISVDFAIYIKSVNNLTSPEISSIKVYFNSDTSELAKTYSIKEYSYDANEYRKINKIYPVEFGNKSFHYRYIFKLNNGYYVYKNNTWSELDITSNTLENIKENWLKLKELSMEKAELSTIPENILSTKLTGNNFIIIQLMKIRDINDQEYNVIFNIDYSKKYISNDNFTLSITMNDGTEKSIAGISKNEAENILDWLERRQKGKGTIFYVLKNNNVQEFLNYYMIQSIKVTE